MREFDLDAFFLFPISIYQTPETSYKLFNMESVT